MLCALQAWSSIVGEILNVELNYPEDTERLQNLRDRLASGPHRVMAANEPLQFAVVQAAKDAGKYVPDLSIKDLEHLWRADS